MSFYCLLDKGTKYFEIALSIEFISCMLGTDEVEILATAVEQYGRELWIVDGLHFEEDYTAVYLTREGCKILFTEKEISKLDSAMFADMYADYGISVSDLDEGLTVFESQIKSQKEYLYRGKVFNGEN